MLFLHSFEQKGEVSLVVADADWMACYFSLTWLSYVHICIIKDGCKIGRQTILLQMTLAFLSPFHYG